MAATLNLAGRRFGRLIAVGDLGTRALKQPHTWICQCDCGNITSTLSSSLRSGGTRSCGCLQKESCAVSAQRKIIPLGHLSADGRLRGTPRALRLKQEAYEAQNGKCAMCGNPLPEDFKKAYWDHCHLTNKFRGLIHPICNTVVGYLETNPELVEKAREYVRDKI